MARAMLRYSCRQCHAEFAVGTVRDGDWIGRYVRDHAADPRADSPILHECSCCRVGIADLVGVQFIREACEGALSGRSPPLTKRQRGIFNWFLEQTSKNSYQPSVREGMRHFGISSPNGMMSHLRAIARKGFIDLAGTRSRGLTFHRRTPIGEGEKV